MRPMVLLATISVLGPLAAPAAADDSPPEAVVATAPDRCAPADLRALAERVGGSVVRVEAPMTLATGFVFHSRRHVVTTFSAVETGRGILVGEDRQEATVVAYDSAHDLAILEVPSPLAGRPLDLGESPALGDPVVGVDPRHWLDEPDAPIVQPGTVTSLSDHRLRTDVIAIAGLGAGSPIVDCSGEVVAVAHGSWSGLATRVEHLADLEDRLAEGAEVPAEPYSGGWSLAHPSLSFIGQIEHRKRPGFDDRHDGWLGLSLGTALIGDDRWYFPFRLGIAGLVSPDRTPLDKRTGYRFQLETGVGYRFLLLGGEVPIYLVPKIGVTLAGERLTTERYSFATSPCAVEPCPVAVGDPLRVDRDMFRVMPTLGLSAQIGPAEIGYQFQLDPKDPSRSLHQMTVGLQF
ncbi:MAG: serine protease [Polyangiaceae bacterium]